MEVTKRVLDRLLGALLIFLMGISVINVLWQVFSRFILNDPSSFTQETARFLLIWIGVLGAGFSVGKRDHLALELLPERLTGRARQWLGVGIETCIIVFAVTVMIVGGMRLAYIQFTLGQTSASLNLPIGYVYLVLPLSGAVMVFYAALHLEEYLRTLRQGAPASGDEPDDDYDDEDLMDTGI